LPIFIVITEQFADMPCDKPQSSRKARSIARTGLSAGYSQSGGCNQQSGDNQPNQGVQRLIISGNGVGMEMENGMGLEW
jgi:hypothetical protein